MYALGGHGEAFSILRECRKYIDQEIRAPNNQLPPLEDGLALSVIRNEARRYRRVPCGTPSQCNGPVLKGRSCCCFAGADRQAGLAFVCIAILHTDSDTGLDAPCDRDLCHSGATQIRTLLFVRTLRFT